MSRIPPRPEPGSAPTTPSQRRDWHAHHSRTDNSFLNLGMAFELDGPVVDDALDAAVDQLVSRHEALRTRFAMSGDRLMQIIEPRESSIRPRLATAGGSIGQAEAGWLDALLGQPFDLQAEVPFRAFLGTGKRSGRWLGIVMHHIVSDQISMGVAIEDLSELLTAQIEQREPALAELSVQFPDYAAWWDGQWRSGRFARNSAYWRDQLAGAPESTSLPAVCGAAAKAADEVRQVPAEIARGLASCAAQFRTTPYVVLLAAFSAALAGLTGATDQVFACGYANRPTAPLRRGIGRFVSGMALRLQSRPDAELADVVAMTHAVAMGGYANAVASLDAVLESGLLGERTTRTPFANVAFQLVDAAADALRIPGVSVRPLEIGAATTKRDLHVTVERLSDRLTIYATYRRSSIAPDWVRELLAGFAGRLSRLVCPAGDLMGPP